MKRLASPLLLAATALCFALPFATVSCDDSTVQMTGIELATGNVPTAVDEGGDPDPELTDAVVTMASPTAALALSAAVIGALVGLLVARAAGAAGLIAGGISAGALASLFLLSQTWAEEADRHAGYWL